MASEFEELTIAKLKDLLREHDQPVSGNKSVLIQRLEEYKSQDIEEKIEFNCSNCGARLRIPESYHGSLTCPSCSHKQDSYEVHNSSGFAPVQFSKGYLLVKKIKNFDPKNITQNDISLALSIIGLLLGILAIYVFFSAFTLDAWCPEEYRSTIVVDGEEAISCNSEQFLWETGMAKRIFNACCIMIPGSFLLTVLGYNLRKENVVVQENSASVDAATPSNNISDSRGTKVIQATAMGFGIGMITIVAIIGIVITALIVLVIYSLFNS